MPTNAFFRPETDTLLTDLRDGLRYIYDGRAGRLPWRTTFNELGQLPFVQQTNHHAFENWPVFHVDAPLRLGQLEVQGVEINRPEGFPQSRLRSDRPVDGYPFEVRLVEHGPDGYWQLKNYISRTLGKPVQCWERPNDQFNADWTYEGLNISVTYWFKKMVRRSDWEYTSLYIVNNRVYPDYLTDAYTKTFTMNKATHWQTFSVPYVSVPHNYRTSQYVRFTPVPIQKEMQQHRHNLAVWFDQNQGVVGIAQPDYALVLPFSGASRFTLKTVDLDRGQYEDELTMHGLSTGSEVMATASVGSLNLVLDALRKWMDT